MLSWALTLLIVAIISGTLSLSGLAGTASSIAWIVFMITLLAALVFFIGSHRPRVF